MGELSEAGSEGDSVTDSDSKEGAAAGVEDAVLLVV